LFAHVNWGIGLIDFDNDGYRDLFIANGHTEDNIEMRVRGAAYRAPNSLLRNQGDGTFVNVSEISGDGLLPIHASRGAAFDDLDNNGRIDAVILNSRQHPTILRNDSPGGHHWVQLRLVGRKPTATPSVRGSPSSLAIWCRSPKCTAAAVTRATTDHDCISDSARTPPDRPRRDPLDGRPAANPGEPDREPTPHPRRTRTLESIEFRIGVGRSNFTIGRSNPPSPLLLCPAFVFGIQRRVGEPS
jgi:hypothetical protein